MWQEQRRYTLQTLRQFGFGCRSESLEKEIQTQITQFVEIVKNGPKYTHEMVCCDSDFKFIECIDIRFNLNILINRNTSKKGKYYCREHSIQHFQIASCLSFSTAQYRATK